MDIKKNPDQGKDNYLLRVSSVLALEFPTESEARLFMAKIETAKAIIEVVQSMASATDGAGDRWQEFWDITNTVGAFTDLDVDPLGITAAELGACVSFLEAFGKFMAGEAVTPTVWRTTINQVRRVQL